MLKHQLIAVAFLVLSFVSPFAAAAEIQHIELSPEEAAFVAAQPVIKVANEMDWPPFDYNEFGTPKGMSIDYFKLVAEKAGLQVEFISGFTWGELLEQFKNKKIDVMPALYRNSEREAFTLFTEPYYQGRLSIFTHKQGAKVLNLSDLVGKRVGIQTSHGSIPHLQSQIPGIRFVEDPRPETLVMMLGKKELDAIIGSPLLVRFFAGLNRITQIELARDIEMSPKDLKDVSLHVGVRNDEPLLRQILTKAMQEVSEVEIAELVEKWGSAQARVTPPPMIVLTPKERAFLNAHPTIRVSNEMDWPPFDFAIDGTPQGFSIDLLNLLAMRSGLKVEYVNGFSWAELVEQFKRGELDLLHSLNKTPERENIADFSVPYRRDLNYFIVRTDHPDVTDIKQLYGKVVAVGEGWSVDEYLTANHPEIKLLRVASLERMVDAVSRGDAEAIISDVTARYMIKKLGIDNLRFSNWFKAFDKGDGQKLYFAAQKNMPELISILNKGLTSLAPGDLDVLNRKWFGEADTGDIFRISLSNQEQTYLEHKSVINLCIDPQWMPYEFLNSDGRHDGLSGDYFRLFEKRIGIPIQLHVTKSWSDTLNAAEKRLCDVVPLADNTEDRRAYLNFTKPYLSLPYVVATKNDQFFIENIEDELDKTYAVVRDYAVARQLREQYPRIRLLEVDNIVEGLHKVTNGDAFGYIGVTAVIANALRKEGILGLKVAGKLSFGYQLGIATRNDEPLLNGIFQKAIDTLSQDEAQRIHNKWMAVNTETVVDYTLLWRFVAGGLVVILVFVYWNRKLNIAKLALEDAQRQLEQQNKALERLSITDALTGLYNRGKLDEGIANEIARAERHGHDFGIVMLDIDHFKAVNDTHGHQVGDDVLVAIAGLLKKHTRVNDVVGRWGGEEFVIICPETEREGVRTLSEKIRASIAAYDFPVIGCKTSSFGVAMYKPGDTLDGMIANADKALYAAKADGRNCIKIL